MDEREEARLRVNAQIEQLERQPIYTDILKTTSRDTMECEIWAEILEQDKTDDLRVSQFYRIMPKKTLRAPSYRSYML